MARLNDSRTFPTTAIVARVMPKLMMRVAERSVTEIRRQVVWSGARIASMRARTKAMNAMPRSRAAMTSSSRGGKMSAASNAIHTTHDPSAAGAAPRNNAVSAANRRERREGSVASRSRRTNRRARTRRPS